ncbi:hypothetical protein SAMN05216548_113107 [Faunimonas pinastri]|uniref:Uncharacterized protein n=1 Tax=Faunimonas pinastri TaxID=1855383 RepID=A0A1H9MH84_9HYPH|nr:hypothetical protein [Faunimonas pinastri]SER22775.1 hypothetical protein SAMN05216548_113107 [Faunimonas pinastri]
MRIRSLMIGAGLAAWLAASAIGVAQAQSAGGTSATDCPNASNAAACPTDANPGTKAVQNPGETNAGSGSHSDDPAKGAPGSLNTAVPNAATGTAVPGDQSLQNTQPGTGSTTQGKSGS